MKKVNKKVAKARNLAARRDLKKRLSRKLPSSQDLLVEDETVINEEESIEEGGTVISAETPICNEQSEQLEEFAEAPLVDSEPLKVGMFTIKSFNQTLVDAAKNKEPAKLFDEFWYETETCCLYADSNVGKSILAVQIARGIANDRKVLYFDFELNEFHFKRRYSDDETKEPYKFSPNLYRVSLNYMMDAYSVEELPDQIMYNIEKSVKETGASVIIIDNLTWIAYNSRSAKMASELMKRLTALKVQYSLSMLILAHTPKRNMSKPITQNDLGGSRMLMNFLDSAFAIGCSAKDPAIRYLKQIKVRYAELHYGEDNVWLCVIEKIRSFLMFRRIGYGMESEHLKRRKNEDKQAIIAKIKAMRSAGATLREIADELGMTIATVDRWSKL